MKHEITAYNAVISACQKGQQPEQAMKVFQAMHFRDLVPDVISMGSLVLAFTASGQYKRASAILTESVAGELGFGVNTFGALIMENEKRCLLHKKAGFLSSLGEVYGGG